MSRARNRRLPVVRAVGLLALGSVWAVACGGPQSLGAAGSVCFRADDCQAGLACIPETMGAAKHVCSADLSGIVSMVDGAAPDSGEVPDPTGGASQGGADPGTAGTEPGGAGGKPAAGGATGAAGGVTTAGAPAGGSASAGASAGGAAAAGAPAGGSSGESPAGGGAANGGASA